MRERINRLKKIDKDLNDRPQKENIDFQDFLKKTPKKETDPFMKMYIRGQKSEEVLKQEAKTMELENPHYERHAFRTTKNVQSFFMSYFSKNKQCSHFFIFIL